MAELDVSRFQEGMPIPDVTGVIPVVRYGRNESGRDFVVGDIHGMFAALTEVLESAGFDEGRDRLFSVGDLVDRGPGSREALLWLDKPWFHACRGNHEQFVIDSNDPELLEIWVQFNGGEWWLELGPEEQEMFRDRFRQLPLAMEVETQSGMVGIVHADVPLTLAWDEFVHLIEHGDPEACFYALWSRNRIAGGHDAPVKGRVDRVYCGHTPTIEAVVLDNVYYIDTGACYCYEGYENARLTLVEIHPERHRGFQVRTCQRTR
jgi:serine/threonine protein phosphatase 1